MSRSYLFFINYTLICEDFINHSLHSCADNSTVKPNLFVLSPLLPESWEGKSKDLPPEVCLATNFRPKGGNMILNLNNGSRSVNTSRAVLSTAEKTYFFAESINETIHSCELHDSLSNNENSTSYLLK